MRQTTLYLSFSLIERGKSVFVVRFECARMGQNVPTFRRICACKPSNHHYKPVEALIIIYKLVSLRFKCFYRFSIVLTEMSYMLKESLEYETLRFRLLCFTY